MVGVCWVVEEARLLPTTSMNLSMALQPALASSLLSARSQDWRSGCQYLASATTCSPSMAQCRASRWRAALMAPLLTTPSSCSGRRHSRLRSSYSWSLHSSSPSSRGKASRIAPSPLRVPSTSPRSRLTVVAFIARLSSLMKATLRSRWCTASSAGKRLTMTPSTRRSAATTEGLFFESARELRSCVASFSSSSSPPLSWAVGLSTTFSSNPSASTFTLARGWHT